MERTRECTFGEYCRAARENVHGKKKLDQEELNQERVDQEESETDETVAMQCHAIRSGVWPFLGYPSQLV